MLTEITSISQQGDRHDTKHLNGRNNIKVISLSYHQEARIMAKDKQKRFLLRMDDSLFERLSNAADADGRSINAYIVKLLSQAAPHGTWEQRQLIGRSLSGKELDTKSGLVLVAGIYYRYLLESPEKPDPTASYTITESNGNILTLKKI